RDPWADINECERLPQPCAHRCLNTPGSHRCLCPAGYRLMANGKTCQGETLPLPVHRHTLSSKLPEGSSHRVDIHRDYFTHRQLRQANCIYKPFKKQHS
uniref:EGF-like domain-containing protein n=1 Tax=Fundulus heteroclitus TaxID=8078 RepID=A0A3Q2PHS1_FUNHE